MCQRMHGQNHGYANKSWSTHVRDVCQLLNPDFIVIHLR